MKKDIIKVYVPDGRVGNWEIKTFTVTKNDAILANMDSDMRGREIKHGTYKKLVRWTDNKFIKSGYTIMSNTPAEVRDHMPFIEKAVGDVLIFGLGLGMVVQALINKPEVTSITVIEKSKDVIKLSGKYYTKKSKKVTVIQGDALTYYDRKSKYGAIWFDIWDDICAENIAEMSMLKNRWKKNSKIRMCWAEKDCKRLFDENEAFFARIKAIRAERDKKVRRIKTALR